MRTVPVTPFGDVDQFVPLGMRLIEINRSPSVTKTSMLKSPLIKRRRSICPLSVERQTLLCGRLVGGEKCRNPPDRRRGQPCQSELSVRAAWRRAGGGSARFKAGRRGPRNPAASHQVFVVQTSVQVLAEHSVPAWGNRPRPQPIYDGISGGAQVLQKQKKDTWPRRIEQDYARIIYKHGRAGN